MNNVTKEEFKTVRDAVDYYMEDMITEKDSLFYSIVMNSKEISIQKKDDAYVIVKKVKVEKSDEKRDFVLLGKLKEDEVSIQIDEKIKQGPLNYERLRQGNYSIQDDTIKKEYSHLYTVSIDDRTIPIDDGVWIEEEHFSNGDNNLINNCQNIVSTKKNNKTKSLHKI